MYEIFFLNKQQKNYKFKTKSYIKNKRIKFFI